MKPPSRAEALDRHQKEMLRRRQLAKMLPNGGLGGRAGVVAPMPHQRLGGAVPRQIVQLQEPGNESVPVDQTGPVKVAESNKFPVQAGGIVHVVVTLKTALSSPGEIQLLRNGVVFGIEALAAGQTLQTIGPWTEERFQPMDTIQLAITNAGSGGVGFHAELRFS